MDVEELALFELEGGFGVMLTLVLNEADRAWNVRLADREGTVAFRPGEILEADFLMEEPLGKHSCGSTTSNL